MQVYNSIPESLKAEKAIITMGGFDGVHKGHQSLIDLMKLKAAEITGETILITFEPHPRLVLEPNDPAFRLITSYEEKIILFEKAQIDHIIFLPFTLDFAQTSSKSFVEDILIKKLNLKELIIGFNHRFGIYREGNYNKLVDFSKELNFNVTEVPQCQLNGETISSSKIRKALFSGDLKHANDMLGYNYLITGIVKEGEKIGRTLNYPTANLHPRNNLKLIPAKGVYASYTEVNGSTYKSMTYIGNRPSLNANDSTIETHIFDFNEDIYTKEIKVSLVERTRDQIKFKHIEELKSQIEKDQIQILSILNK